jgi:hypothetical protein
MIFAAVRASGVFALHSGPIAAAAMKVQGFLPSAFA